MAYSGLMGILAVDDEEGELAHWAWGYDSENLSNVEEVAGKKTLYQFSGSQLLKDELQRTLFYNFYRNNSATDESFINITIRVWGEGTAAQNVNKHLK